MLEIPAWPFHFRWTSVRQDYRGGRSFTDVQTSGPLEARAQLRTRERGCMRAAGSDRVSVAAGDCREVGCRLVGSAKVGAAVGVSPRRDGTDVAARRLTGARDEWYTEPRPKPRIVISKCIGFEACRYNGEIVEDKFVRRLAGNVEFICVCPEVEIGLGTPREAVRIVSAGDGFQAYSAGQRVGAHAANADVYQRFSVVAERCRRVHSENEVAVMRNRRSEILCRR